MTNQPLADKIRPHSFDEMVGQSHLIGAHGVLRRALENGRITNMIFSGPPGTGKTTCANIIAASSDLQLYKLNATTASLADVKAIASETNNVFGAKGILLYLDEIQYFNRKQQQSLLEYIEDGRITLIASTTENPYFCVYNAIISRSAVYEFKPVTPNETAKAIKRALEVLNAENKKKITVSDEVAISLAKLGAGDVRKSLGLLENAYYISDNEITEEIISEISPSFTGVFDAAGDAHYDLLSAYQKSIRGSDPDAAVFYLAKILAGGDLLSVIRRIQVIASEDIGLAYPMAVSIVHSATESARELGLPEAAIPLANATIMLATAPKSNSAYLAYVKAMEDIEKGLGNEIPEHLRSPLYKGYKYPHNFQNHYVKQQYLPNDIKDKKYYFYQDNKAENAAKAYFELIRKELQ